MAVDMPPVEYGDERDELADRVRLVAVRRRMERAGIAPGPDGPIRWDQMRESEREQWRDLVDAVREVTSP